MARPEKPRPTPKRLLGWNIVQTVLGVSILLVIAIAPKFWASLPFQSDPVTHDNYTAICCVINGTQCAIVLWRALDVVIDFFNNPV